MGLNQAVDFTQVACLAFMPFGLNQGSVPAAELGAPLTSESLSEDSGLPESETRMLAEDQMRFNLASTMVHGTLRTILEAIQGGNGS